MQYKKYKNRTIRHLFSAPFIYAMIIPLLILDISAEIYHQICFRLYRIPRVKRKKYIKIDRHKLQYLSTFDKINCAYCGYANGLINYAKTIAAETEKYWCSIKHNKDREFIEPEHHQEFFEYGDKEGYRKIKQKMLK